MSTGIIYTRVSTKEQAEKRLSLDNQKAECKAFARKAEIIIPDSQIFSDEGESDQQQWIVVQSVPPFPESPDS